MIIGPRGPRPVAAALALLALSGCTLLQTTLTLPERAVSRILPQKDGDTADPVELQQQLMRFSDDFLASMLGASESLRRNGQKLDPIELRTLQLQYTDNIQAVATGQNAFADLLDMAALVALTRMTVEDHWIPGEYRESARPLLNACREGEKQIWQIADGVLAPGQIAELRKAIAAWHRDNPTPEAFRTVRALGFSSMIAKASRPTDASRFPSVFKLLDIDPLSGLDPATRELAQTRLFAERALFLAQRLPNLVRQQTELLALQTAGLPELREAIAASTQLAAAADRFSQTTERLPDVIGHERAQILAALADQQRGLTALAAETRQAFTAGTQMAAGTDQALRTFGAVAAQLTADTGPPRPDAKPFRIADYTAAAARIEQAAARLTGLLDAFGHSTDPARFERLAAGFDRLGAKARTEAQAVVDYAFQKALCLIAILCGAVLATALAYRWAAERLRRPPQDR